MGLQDSKESKMRGVQGKHQPQRRSIKDNKTIARSGSATATRMKTPTKRRVESSHAKPAAKSAGSPANKSSRQHVLKGTLASRSDKTAGAGVSSKTFSDTAPKSPSQTPARDRYRRTASSQSARDTRDTAHANSSKTGLGEKVLSSRPTLIALAVIVVVLAALIFDTASNWNKAYGNITVDGVQVGGMTAEEMETALATTFGPRVSHALVTIYASDEAYAAAQTAQPQDSQADNQAAIAEQLAVEDVVEKTDSWTTDALSLKASVPYSQAVDEALSYGRGLDGIAARLGLIFTTHDIEITMKLDKDALEDLASEIERTVGDPRVDATVQIEDGVAHAVDGHDGTSVDRTVLAQRISDAMIRGDVPDTFVADVVSAPSRIGLDAAQSTSDQINHALQVGAAFVYEGKKWEPSAAQLGEWTSVQVESDGDGYRLAVGIDSTNAVPAVVKGAGASITNDDITVTFEDSADGVVVHTQGSGNIPEVNPAIRSLEEALYGDDGIAWDQQRQDKPLIEIDESDRPESLPFDQAVELGIITTIGEYTTEFSNAEGTENRNHNIKLVSDILDGGIIDAEGGSWDFNFRSGDTNEEAGFWSAGSIVDGEYVDSIGGGICQVATTIFNAVFEAGLDVITRHNHTLYIASYPAGRDAAVSYPDVDLTWQNNLESDILLRLSYTDDSVTAKLYSVYTGYTTSAEVGEWEEGDKYSTRFELDDSLPSDYYYLKTVGEDGSEIAVYRTVRDRYGDVILEDSFASIYAPKDEIYVVGPDTDTSKLRRTTTDA